MTRSSGSSADHLISIAGADEGVCLGHEVNKAEVGAVRACHLLKDQHRFHVRLLRFLDDVYGVHVGVATNRRMHDHRVCSSRSRHGRDGLRCLAFRLVTSVPESEDHTYQFDLGAIANRFDYRISLVEICRSALIRIMKIRADQCSIEHVGDR